ncbi:hypothetical protein BDQ12DRAFT_714428 [Crucibulum laeve]|uniref:Uncharacterized protein n=1 Tax=Crucibulum laeve TaxID=68775 RepID=A0A5C3LTD4_9AGAR|nr:hypothetical protein BDQ12DRAFT_714428 [Crucibulum laeve]
MLSVRQAGQFSFHNAARSFSRSITSSKAKLPDNRTGRRDTGKAGLQPDQAIMEKSTDQNDTTRYKTVAELDAELLEKLNDISGDGAGAGVEYEDGKPATMKRNVRNNMFRYI